MMIGARWLGACPTLSRDFGAWHIDEEHVTRVEEFTFVRNLLLESTCRTVLDAGTGWALGAHMLPYILGDCGLTVYAVDIDPATLQMPPHKNVFRLAGDITNLVYPDRCVDAWVCVSVLEHMEPDAVRRAIHEGFRVLRPGGLAILTMDESGPEGLTAFLHENGFLVGNFDATVPEAPLTPQVGVVVGVKPL